MVGLILQEEVRQNRDVELFCRNLKRKRVRERGRKRRKYDVFRNAGAQGRECANKEGDREKRGMGGKWRLEIERNHGGWRSGGSGAERDKFLR